MTEPLSMKVRGLKVTEMVGEPTRFLVESSKGGKYYLTDIADEWPQGSCTCPNHSCVRVAEFKRTNHVDPCKHIVASLCFFALRKVARDYVIETQLHSP